MGYYSEIKNFEFDLRYEVTSFTMSYPGSGGEQVH